MLHRVLILALFFTAAGCDFLTDAATRIAYDIEAGEGRLGRGDGAKYRIEHRTPSTRDQCTGPYKVQIDKVGMLVIWCYDDAGRTVSSHSTSYHHRFVDTPRTWILDKPAGSTLVIDLERRGGRAVIADVR
ncbi:MAG TPA: hypothetical protein VJQ51_11440 [Burkholderiales bacterium]|nr:hypothetical protein [Burkholderiales bacterium]